MDKHCIICYRPATSKLCTRCSKSYVWESKLNGARLKKRFTSNTARKKHNFTNEKKFYHTLKKFFKDPIYRDYRPVWALSPKGVCLEYDICIPTTNTLIEIDGPYHHDRSLYNSDAAFEYRQVCDHLKEVHAEENGWNFIRVNLSEFTVNRPNIIKLLNLKSKKIRRFF